MDDRATLASALTGRYELDREIGRGGMATVYLARDVRHTRPVALKVLSPELAAVLGAERFLSEIRVTANLQHPNLLPLFDSGEAHGLLFYVMPFVDGETLRHKLDREKQLPVDEAVRIASGIAAALDYAHRHGVIHRDLKPENILLHDGQPLVADFGIALAVSNAGGQRVTQTGLSLGTPQYMSPEQATGDRNIDARTDIYSLGALTYEMLTGEPPHTGATAQAIIARLMTDDPRPIAESRRTVPQFVDDAVQCALHKLPADRFATAKDFADALRGERSALIKTSLRASSPRQAAKARAVYALAGIMAGCLIGGTATYTWRRSREPVPHVERFTIEPPSGMTIFDQTSYHAFAMSPDGQTFAFAAGPRMALYVRRLDQLEPTPVGTLDGITDMAFSPNGRSLAVAPRNGGVRTVAIGANDAAASATVVADSVRSQGLDWSFGPEILTSFYRQLVAVSPGGTQRVMLKPDTSFRLARNPVLLGKGGLVAFTEGAAYALPGGLTDSIQVISLDGKSRRSLGLQGLNVLGVLDDILFYGAAGGRIMGVHFDARAGKLLGEPVTLLEHVGGSKDVRAALSRSGTLAYLTASGSRPVQILDTHGAIVSTLPVEPREWGDVNASRDGKRLALNTVSVGGHSELWVYDMASRVTAKLDDNVLQSVRWTPDGKRIAFIRNEPGGFVPYWMPADGSARPERVPNTLTIRFNGLFDFSPDGKYLVATARPTPAAAIELVAVPLDGKSPQFAITTAGTVFGTPSVSPDGKWLAYTTTQGGGFEVFVRPFAARGGTVQISVGGGRNAIWTPDGRHLIYDHNGYFRNATLDVSGAMPRLVRSDSLFPNDYLNHAWMSDSRLAAIAVDSKGPRLIVVTNWLVDARSKVLGR